MTAALLSFDIGAAIAAAKARPLPAPEELRVARRRNRAAAYIYLRDRARSGVRSTDPATERLLAMLRRERR